MAVIAASAAMMTFIAVGPAQADAAKPASCTAGYACLWEDQDYLTEGSGSAVIKFQMHIPRLSQFNYSAGRQGNDNATSVYNNGNLEWAKFFKDSSQGGSFFQLGRGLGDWNLSNGTGNVASGFNDNLSSTCFKSYCN